MPVAQHLSYCSATPKGVPHVCLAEAGIMSILEPTGRGNEREKSADSDFLKCHELEVAHITSAHILFIRI